MSLADLIIHASILLIAGFSYFLKKLDISGVLSGIFLSFTLLLVFGPAGLLPLALFFFLGIAFTRVGKNSKSRLEFHSNEHETRNWKNVWSNSVICFPLCAVAYLFPDLKEVMLIGIYSNFSSALGDTTSSELGSVLGSRYYTITTGKQAKRGIDGAISIEGTLLGFLASAVIAISAYIVFEQASQAIFFIVLAAGIFGNLADSVLGATLQERGKLSNHGVNLLSTCLAALISLLVTYLYLPLI